MQVNIPYPHTKYARYRVEWTLLCSPTTDLSDFSPTTAEVIFQSVNSVNCVSVPISDDEVLESDETFSVSLNTSDPDAMLSPSSATITILNDDSKS